MPPDDPVVVQIPDYSVIFCRNHGEYFRFAVNPPEGMALALRTLMDAFVIDPEVMQMSGQNPENLTGLLPEFAPLCGRYKQSLVTAWRLAGIGRTRECENCGEERIGGEYGLRVPPRGYGLGHICFECCLSRPCDPFKPGEWNP